MIDKKTWEQFQDAGMLWFVNRLLHVFGWAIVVEFDDSDKITAAYPARCKFRGFSEDAEERNFEKVQRYMEANGKEIYEEAEYK